MNVIAESFRQAVATVLRQQLGGYRETDNLPGEVDQLIDLIAEKVAETIEAKECRCEHSK